MINYDLKKIRGIIFDVDGVLSRETITMDESGLPLRTVNIKDGYAIQLAMKMGLNICIITGANVPSIRVRYEGLGVRDVYVGASIKMDIYEEWKQRLGIADDEIIYVGDDIPDMEVMRRVGCPCCPSDACPDIKDVSRYISTHKGGMGVGRDVLEQVLRAQGKWMADRRAFGW